MPSFLLELLTEEIPARMQLQSAEDLKRLFAKGLQEQGLTCDQLETQVTPRRLVMLVQGLPAQQPDREEEKRGPRTDAPAAAIEGFLKAVGVSLEQCEQRETAKGTFYFAVIRQPRQPTATVLPQILGGVLLNFPWPKSMRWGRGAFRWVRPLQGIVALLDGVPLQGGFALGDVGNPQAPLGWIAGTDAADVAVLPFSDTTVGHRVHAPDRFSVTGGADYREKLGRSKVVLSHAERQQRIRADWNAFATREGFYTDSMLENDALVTEVAGLVEYPVPLFGRIDERYMSLPTEVLSTSMRTHQKYFSFHYPPATPEDALHHRLRLAPFFMLVANQETPDGGAAIVAGNERVLRARLADAAYFWDRDRKTDLAAFNTRLESVVFHARLGSISDKAERIAALAPYLGRWLYPDSTAAQLAEMEVAGRLCKADLASGMVGEFPELQGIMGSHYAHEQGASPAVCTAIHTHYRPQGPGDPVPSQRIGAVVALADKLDTVFWMFAAGEIPTGSRDPFALRRAALGIIRILLTAPGELARTHLAAHELNSVNTHRNEAHLAALFAQILKIGGPLAEKLGLGDTDRRAALYTTLKTFLRERFEHFAESQGHRRDIIRAVLNADPFEDLSAAFAKVRQTEAFLQTPEAGALLVAYRRASNILAIEEKKDKTTYRGHVEMKLLVEAAEIDLNMALSGQAVWFQNGQEQADFATILTRIAELRPAIDAFFDAVTVNADDPVLRRNRLNLLARIRDTVNQVADFGVAEG